MSARLLSLVFALVVAVGVGSVLLAPGYVFAAESSSNVTVQVVPGEKLSSRLQSQLKVSWPWYVTRASGIVAAASLIILLLSGIGQITGRTFRLLDPLTAWASHRALGIVFSIAVLIHIFSLLFDHFITFNVWQLLVPWLSGYRSTHWLGLNVGSIYVAMGIIAMYMTAAIVVTSLVWVEKKPASWKLVHYLSYMTIFLVFVHALYTGTDMAHGFWRWLWVGLNALVFLAVVARLWRVRTI